MQFAQVIYVDISLSRRHASIEALNHIGADVPIPGDFPFSFGSAKVPWHAWRPRLSSHRLTVLQETSEFQIWLCHSSLRVLINPNLCSRHIQCSSMSFRGEVFFGRPELTTGRIYCLVRYFLMSFQQALVIGEDAEQWQSVCVVLTTYQ